MKYMLNTEQKVKDYEKTVELFNKNNYFNIGDEIFICVTEAGYPPRVLNVRVDLGVYGKLDHRPNMFDMIITPKKYRDMVFEFQPVFIIGKEPIPGPGEEYGKRVINLYDFSILPGTRMKLPNSGLIYGLNPSKRYEIMEIEYS